MQEIFDVDEDEIPFYANWKSTLQLKLLLRELYHEEKQTNLA